MNKFYSISEHKDKLISEYQLENLGEQIISMIIGGYSRRDFYGARESKSTKLYKKVTSDDYDNLFANKLISFKPPYELEKILDYHYDYYITINDSKETFIKHIKYVIIPIIEKRKKYSIQVELITNWINQKMEKKKKNEGKVTFKTGDINSPIQVQINSDNSEQSQEINYSSDDIIKLFEILKNDIDKLDKNLREDLNIEIENAKKQLEKGKNIKSRLLTIGEIIKDIGIDVFTNLISSPVYQLFRPLLGI